MTPSHRVGWIRVISVIAIAFGLLTIKEGGAVLFVDGAGREDAGNYVAFVLWFNFLAGFAYIITGIGLWARRHWAVWLAVTTFAGTALIFAAFAIHVYSGGAFEQRTVIAMSVRSLVWAGIATFAWLWRTTGVPGKKL